MKRGFKTEEDALAWERSYKEHCKKDMPMSSIKPLDVLKWQNELLQMQNKDGKGLSGTYLKTICRYSHS